MGFYEILDQVVDLLRRRGRVTYRALRREFQVDDAFLEDLKAKIITAQRLAVDEHGEVLVWVGETGTPPALQAEAHPQQGEPHSVAPRRPEAERRQLTVLFCDLVDSTSLASQLDPEDLREVVRAYQETCAKVIARFEGHIAQYLGDGLLVYFGYPLAHEDDAQRAVRAGLGMVEALGQLNTRLGQERGVQLAVRLGIHTGLVVVGDVGGGTRQEQLALGETPNLAARLRGLAAPNTLVISAATLPLLGGFFACQSLGTPLLKGFAQPLEVYQVLYESMARSRLEATAGTGLTPLVGREQEVGLLLERWAQVKDGLGQVVLLSGEAGIGKSRLVQVLKEHVASEPQAWLTPCQCSPYYQNSALYPMIDLLERVALRFDREESSQQKLSKLEGFLVQYGLPLAEAVPFFAPLLSLPLTADYAPLTLSPAQQRQKTLQAFLTILLRIAAQQPVLFVMEDLHWVDPTTLELLTLLIDQGPTARILALLTFRPDFPPPWTSRSHLTQVTLSRLPRRQAAEMTSRVAHGKVLPAEVVEQVVAKTDGVPLFVEELTKMVLDSGLLQERAEGYALTGPLPPLAIPATLHDSLMARLDRLAAVKGLAQLGATLGRDFAYALLQAVAPPELLAHHYTEASLTAQAIPYWLRAGQRAIQRSANLEAISHLAKGLELLHTLPDSPERDRQELALQTALGMAAQTIKGYAAPEVEQAYARARTLCQQVGDTAQFVSVLRGQWIFYSVRADYRTALELGQQMLALAEDDGNPEHLVEAHLALGVIAIYRGNFIASRRHLEQGIALYHAHGQPLQTFHYMGHSRVFCLSYLARTLWLLGYVEQALQRSQEGLTLAQRLSIPMTVAQAQGMHALLYQVRRDIALTQEWSEKTVAYAAEYGFPYWLTLGSMYKGWALAQQGQLDVGIAQFLQGLEAYRATGAKLGLSWFLAVLAELYGKSGQIAEGLRAMAEARAHINNTEEVYYEAEVHRLTGELLLMQGGPEAAAAEARLLQALEVARRQSAKSWELRAATSLARLWRAQGRCGAAQELLAPIYGWFTEGFDTADLQEAKALLEELA